MATAKRVLKKKKKRVAKAASTDPFQSAVDELAKSFSVEVMDENVTESVPYYIPFRHVGLQAITGGVPGGKLTLIEGDSQCGKSYLLYELIVECLKMGGYALLSDPENALVPRFMKKAGLSGNQRFLYSNVETQLTRNFSMWRKFVTAIRAKDKTSPILIGADSYPAMQIKVAMDALDKMAQSASDDPEGGKKDELKGYLSARKNAEFAQLLGEFVGFMSKNGVALVFINQLRFKMGVMFGDATTTNAENIFKYYANLRLRGKLGSKIKEDVPKSKETKARQIGVKSVWETIKNRNIDPFKKVETEIVYRDGVDPQSGLLDLLVSEHKLKLSSTDKDKFIYPVTKKRYPQDKLLAFVAKYPEVVNLVG